jgi:hypothetical protein
MLHIHITFDAIGHLQALNCYQDVKYGLQDDECAFIFSIFCETEVN